MSILFLDIEASSLDSGSFPIEAMLERQRDSIAKAKREGRYKGRVRRQADEIISLARSVI